MRTVASFFARAGFAAAVVALSSAPVRASGPVERLLQSLAHPSDPDVIIVRYGVPSGASNGFLFSHDGGKTFKAGCSNLVAPSLKLQKSSSPYVATVMMDGLGQLIVSQNQNELFTGDPTGCTYSKAPGFENRTAVSLALDPADKQGLYALAYTKDPAKPTETNTEVLRRDAAGVWTTVGPLKPSVPKQSVYGSYLLAAKLASGGPRMVALYSVSVEGDTDFSDDMRVGVSEDGGKSWQEYPFANPDDARFPRLVGIDPTNVDRVLAVRHGTALRDQLLLSTDKGATFKPWAEVDEFSAATFGADGRVFISDASDSIDNSLGGLFTAAKLGNPLNLVGEPVGVDCLEYRALDQKLFGCQRDKFGTIDPASGSFQELVRIDAVPALLDCQGKDVTAVCKDQLNTGLAWCCAGHYPCTAFCGDYNVTSSNGKPVLCGLAGRAYDEDTGKVCKVSSGATGADDGGVVKGDAGTATRADAGTTKLDAGSTSKKDASSSGADAGDEDAKSSSDDGCSIKAPGSSRESAGITLASLGLLLLSIGRVLRRRSHS